MSNFLNWSRSESSTSLSWYTRVASCTHSRTRAEWSGRQSGELNKMPCKHFNDVAIRYFTVDTCTIFINHHVFTWKTLARSRRLNR